MFQHPFFRRQIAGLRVYIGFRIQARDLAWLRVYGIRLEGFTAPSEELRIQCLGASWSETLGVGLRGFGTSWAQVPLVQRLILGFRMWDEGPGSRGEK